MKIVCFTGGTLGHIMPCVTLIKEIKKRYKNVDIIVFATTKDTSYEVLKSSEINKVYYIECSKINKNIKAQVRNILAYKQIKKILKEEKVNVAYGFGGYISGIGILAAKSLKIKTYLHEQNSVMGKANKMLSGMVDKVFLSYPVKKMKKNYLLVGNPVYLNALEVKKDIYKIKKKILFTSGTLGAKVVNDLAVNLINNGYLKDYDIYIVTGKKYYDNIRNRVSGDLVHVYPFCDNLINEIASSDIVISRAGSSTLFEIIGTSTLSIIIPSINVTNNHQYHNAMYFKELGCIEMIEEKDLTMSNFINKLNMLIADKDIYLNNIKNYNSNKIYEHMIDEVLG